MRRKHKEGIIEGQCSSGRKTQRWKHKGVGEGVKDIET
jgi:hypothetical protein